MNNVDIKKFAVILPSLNPTDKLCQVVHGLIEGGFGTIILVDDGSAEEFKAPFRLLDEFDQVTVLTHEVNRGKGAGLKTAFSYLINNRPDIEGAVTADGDGQHLLKDIIACAEASANNIDALILGCRDFDMPHVPPRSKKGNKITASIFKTLCGVKISDTQTGLRAIGKEHFPKLLDIRGERYEYESNMLLALHSDGIPFVEVEIETVYEDNNSCSHFRPVQDSVRIYKLILAHIFRRLFRFFKYILSSCASAAVDLLAFWLLHMLLAALGGDSFAEGVGAVWLCTFIARAISSFVNFNINKRFVFSNGGKYGSTIARYYILCVLQLCVSAGLVWLLGKAFTSSASWLLTLLKAAVDTVLFFISYRIQRAWVFKIK